MDREGKDCNTYGKLSCLCLAFFPPSLPIPYCQAISCFRCSSSTSIHLHPCCFPSLLCPLPLCPPAPPRALSCPVSFAHFTPHCPACSQPCCPPAHSLSHAFQPALPPAPCTPPATHKHTQGHNCTTLGILALVSLPVKRLFRHIRPRQECRDIYETLFNVLKSHRLEHLGN